MKILVVDDHVLIREALRGVLGTMRPDALVLEAADATLAAQLVAAHPDVSLILLDLHLPGRDGLEFLGELRRLYPAISIVVLSGFHDRSNVMRALDRGASGFIPKSASRDVMIGALNLVFSGGIYVPPEILGPDAPPARAPVAPGTPQVSPLDFGLTERQVEVLALMMRGRSNKAICRHLDLAEPTVKSHVTAILKALKATNRTEAVIAATALGWDAARLAVKR